MPTSSADLFTLEGSNGKIWVTEDSVRIELYKQKMFTLPPPKWDSSKISKTYEIPRNTITQVKVVDILGTHQFHVYFPKAGFGGFVNVFISDEQKVQAREMMKALTRFETSTEILEHSDANSALEGVVEDQQLNENTLEAFDRATDLDLNRPDAWFTKAKTHYSEGRYEEALKEYDKAIELNPNYAEAWSNKGNALAMLGKYDEALKAVDKAIELNPNYAAAWNNRGGVYYDQLKYDDALKAFDRAVKLDPQYATAWNNKGNVLYSQKNYAEAMHALDKAIEINPQYAAAWSSKGSVLAQCGKYEEALKCLDKAIELDPKLASAWNNKGSILYRQNKYDEALKAVDKAIEFDPRSAAAQNAKKLIQEKLGNFKNETIAEIEKPKIIEFDACPNCKTGRLLVTNKKEFLGLITHHNVSCNICRMSLNDQQVKEFMVKWEHQKDVDIDAWLTGIRGGLGLPIDNSPPIMLKRNETSIFTIPNISLSENRSVRTGGYTSSRFRVAKGVSIGGGSFRSQSHDELVELDKGTLTLTNQRIVFVGKSHSSDIPLKKTMSIEPFKNAIVVAKEGRAKAQQFTGMDKSYFNITVGNKPGMFPFMEELSRSWWKG